jgi:hypothetical protein
LALARRKSRTPTLTRRRRVRPPALAWRRREARPPVRDDEHDEEDMKVRRRLEIPGRKSSKIRARRLAALLAVTSFQHKVVLGV